MLSVLKEFGKWPTICASVGGLLAPVARVAPLRGRCAYVHVALVWTTCLRGWGASVSRVLSWLRGWCACMGDVHT